MTVTTLAYIPSPAQGVWFIGPVPLRAYALCIIIGIVAALVIGDRRWEARGGERGVIYNPLADRWQLSSDMDVNYMLVAQRP